MASAVKDSEEGLQKGDPTRRKILIDSYRESRKEGMELAISGSMDIWYTLAMLGAITGGSVASDEPLLLLLLPLAITIVAIYAIQKFRTSSLITSYMIYLEKRINSDYGENILIWNDKLVSRNISAGRGNVWGWLLIIMAIVFSAVIFGGITWWAYIANELSLPEKGHLGGGFIVVSAFLYLSCLVSLLATLFDISRNQPEDIKELAR